MQQELHLSMDMAAQQYNNLKSRQLGNHHLHSKKSLSQKWNDPRLQVLKPELFINKIVLDIGCNQGILTLPIALKFRPQIIKGVDIDKGLVDKFRSNLSKFKQKNEQLVHNILPPQIITQISELPLYFQEKIHKITHKNTEQIIISIPRIQIKKELQQQLPQFPSNVALELMNYLAIPEKLQFYDTILCMNMTKWIHLAFGDDGIKRLFGNINSMLHEGGILILEAQPWKSYKKKIKLEKIYKQNYQKISLKPQKFKDILKSYGLVLKQSISPNNQAGLKHQIQIYQKKGFYSIDINAQNQK